MNATFSREAWIPIIEERIEEFRLRIQEQDDHDHTQEDPRAIRILEQELNTLLQEEDGNSGSPKCVVPSS